MTMSCRITAQVARTFQRYCKASTGIAIHRLAACLPSSTHLFFQTESTANLGDDRLHIWGLAHARQCIGLLFDEGLQADVDTRCLAFV